ncbi:hypothetical protein BH11PSE7_BH11PSE7_18200 [soil metagenome]
MKIAAPSRVPQPLLKPDTTPTRTGALPPADSAASPDVLIEQQAGQAPHPIGAADVLATMEHQLVRRAQRQTAERRLQPPSAWAVGMEHVRAGKPHAAEAVLRIAIARNDPGSRGKAWRVLAEIINLTDPQRALVAAQEATHMCLGTPDENACRVTYARALLANGLPHGALEVLAGAQAVTASPETFTATGEQRCWITHAMAQSLFDGTALSPDLLHRIRQRIGEADSAELVQLTELCAQTGQFELAKAAVDALVALGAGAPDTWRLPASPLVRPLENLDWWRTPPVAGNDMAPVHQAEAGAAREPDVVEVRQALLSLAAQTSDRSGGDTAVIQAMTGRHAEAEQTLRLLAELNPGSANCRQLLAELLLNKGELKEAAKVASQALEMARGTQLETPCRRTLARICLVLEQPDAALEVLTGREGTAAVKLMRANGRCPITLAMVQAARGVPPDANLVNGFRQSIDSPDAHHRALAELFAKLGMPELARAALRSLAEHGSHYDAWTIPGSPLLRPVRTHPPCAEALHDLGPGDAAGTEITPGAQASFSNDERPLPLESTHRPHYSSAGNALGRRFTLVHQN